MSQRTAALLLAVAGPGRSLAPRSRNGAGFHVMVRALRSSGRIWRIFDVRAFCRFRHSSLGIVRCRRTAVVTDHGVRSIALSWLDISADEDSTLLERAQ